MKEPVSQDQERFSRQLDHLFSEACGTAFFGISFWSKDNKEYGFSTHVFPKKTPKGLPDEGLLLMFEVRLLVDKFLRKHGENDDVLP